MEIFEKYYIENGKKMLYFYFFEYNLNNLIQNYADEFTKKMIRKILKYKKNLIF